MILVVTKPALEQALTTTSAGHVSPLDQLILPSIGASLPARKADVLPSSTASQTDSGLYQHHHQLLVLHPYSSLSSQRLSTLETFRAFIYHHHQLTAPGYTPPSVEIQESSSLTGEKTTYILVQGISSDRNQQQLNPIDLLHALSTTLQTLPVQGVMNGVDYKRFVRYFYDPPPKYDDMSGTPVWLLGNEYKSTPTKPVNTTDHDDVVEVESSNDSHDPSEASESTATDLQPQQTQNTSSGSFDDAQHVSGHDLPSLSNDPTDGGWPHAFLDDFESRIWMTYRSNFTPIPRSQDPASSSSMSFSVRLRNLTEREGFSSDTGWGCMIRSGQSLLANALIVLQLGRDWRRPQATTPPAPPTSSSASMQTEAYILSLFADSPEAPFSIHRFVQHGASACGKHPGQWFGPSATASCIKELSAECAAAGLRVYVTPSASEVYEDRFRTIAATSATDGIIKPTLILLGIRLGLDRITPVYHEALKSAFTYPQSIGIAGGRPSSSHYFIGCQGDIFFYLDPHETRPSLPFHSNASDYTEEEIATCHTRRLRGLRISEMDPSMLIGFLIKDETDWEDWKRRLKEVKGKAIVNVYEKEPPVPGETKERKEAVDEVETFDDEDEDEDDETVTVTGKEEVSLGSIKPPQVPATGDPPVPDAPTNIETKTS